MLKESIIWRTGYSCEIRNARYSRERKVRHSREGKVRHSREGKFVIPAKESSSFPRRKVRHSREGGNPLAFARPQNGFPPPRE
jgi:hypothetical protein